MLKLLLKVSLCLLWVGFMGHSAQAQGLMNRVKSAAKEKAADAIFGDKDNSSNSSDSNDNSSSDTGGNRPGRPGNNTSGGLITTPPDVEKNLSTAESAFDGKKYGEARYALQQAIVGIEMEMGNKVMANLPKKVNGIDYIEDSDKVTSTGMAFAGLTIFREYYNDEQAVDITIASNSAWLSSANMYLTNPAYSSGQENMKAITIQDFRGVLEFSEYEGYKLSVPLGQTSIAVIKLVNMADENAAMKVANEFDLAGIQKQLGDKIK